LLIGCGIFFGLRISDLLQLSWDMLLNDSSFEIIEKKTKKRREVRINKGFQKHIWDCYNALLITDKSEKCFKSRERRVYSIQRINMILKDIKKKYGLKSVKNFSSHSLKKQWVAMYMKEQILTEKWHWLCYLNCLIIPILVSQKGI
jgi:integrase